MVGSLVVVVDFCVLILSVLELVVAGFQLVVWKSQGSNISLLVNNGRLIHVAESPNAGVRAQCLIPSV